MSAPLRSHGTQLLRRLFKIRLPCWSVEVPAWREATRARTGLYTTEERQSQAGWIGGPVGKVFLISRLTVATLMVTIGSTPACKRASAPARAEKTQAPAKAAPDSPLTTMSRAAAAGPTSPGPTAPRPGASGRPIPGLRMDATHSAGAPIHAENLTIFPIYASVQANLGTFTTLQSALTAKTAEVREVGTGRPGQPSARPRPTVRHQRTTNPNPPATVTTQSESNRTVPAGEANSNPYAVSSDNRQAGGSGARVNQLEIVNRGDVPIVVLAGTVVKGGKQDRQIGQDFVIGPNQAVAVDAFCVEQGRWNPNRTGKATGGRFQAVDSLANLPVRNAGQYAANQSLVWKKVAEVNRDNAVKAGSGTLMATLDNAEIRKRRAALLGRITAQLGRVPHPRQVVGLAYAVDGRVRSVRWFFSNDLYRKFVGTLVNTAAVEALTAQAASRTSVRSSTAIEVNLASAADVRSFVQAFKKAAVRRRRVTRGLNDNVYYRSSQGYKSKAHLRNRGTDHPVSVDISAK